MPTPDRRVSVQEVVFPLHQRRRGVTHISLEEVMLVSRSRLVLTGSVNWIDEQLVRQKTIWQAGTSEIAFQQVTI